METKWFCRILGKEIGPLSSQDLVELVRSGTLTKNDPVRRQGNNKWIRAREVEGLFRLAASDPATAAGPDLDDRSEPVPSADKTEAGEPLGQGARRTAARRLVLGSGIVIVVATVIVVALAWRSCRTSPGSGPLPGQSQPGDAAKLKASFTQDFHEQFQPRLLELIGGSRPDQLSKLGPKGLHVRIPDDLDVPYCGVSPKIVVKGDFEITAAFTIIDLPRPKEGFGAGVQIYIEDPRHERAAIQRLHREREGHMSAAYRGVITEDGSHQHHAKLQKAAATSGWLRLKRKDTRIQYQVADLNSDTFTQIHETEFTDEDVVLIRLIAQTGGSPTRVDAAWTYLDIRAEELDDGSEPSTKPRTLLVAVVVVLLILLVAAVCLVLRLRASRRASTRPDEQAAGATKT
ncbi:MAG: DUF1583 domain-containing protein [Planctomycetes bacterium]|nr:DUF1583 domain-containing protein [Planctomycetota bacterium]